MPSWQRVAGRPGTIHVPMVCVQVYFRLNEQKKASELTA